MKINKIFHAILLFSLLMGSVGVQKTRALGTPQIVSISPGSPAPVGTNVSIRATVQWDSDFRSMRICFRDTNWCQEDGTPDITKNFDTSGLSAGSYLIIAQVAKVGEGWDTATQTQTSYELTDNSQPNNPPTPSSPQITCSVDTFDVWPNPANVGNSIHITGSGSCNTGVRAVKVKVDGGDLYEIGNPNLDTNWNTNGVSAGQHQLKLLVAGQGDNSWSNAATQVISVQLNAPNEPAPAPSSPFNTGDIINIQGNIYVIVANNGSIERRHIPNPETLDALGIPRSWIDNKGLSNAELKAIHQGDDVPDVNRDYQRFIDFKNRYFSNTTPINPDQPSNPNAAFSTGNVIQIGYDIYIIVNGERRLVPNPETMDALGISRNWIDNKGFGDSDLKNIPLGQDIPDVNRDPSGFAEFKNRYFSSTTPIVPGTGTKPTQPPAPNQPQQPNAPSDGQWQVGARVGLCAGAQIRSGSSFSYPTHTIVPENNWQADIVDGPRNNGGVTWWDISRANIDGGGTGWVYFEQAGLCHSGNDEIPTPFREITPALPNETSPDNNNPDTNPPSQSQFPNNNNQESFNETVVNLNTACDANYPTFNDPTSKIFCGSVSIMQSFDEMKQYAETRKLRYYIHSQLSTCNGTLSIVSGLVISNPELWLFPPIIVAEPLSIVGSAACRVIKDYIPK